MQIQFYRNWTWHLAGFFQKKSCLCFKGCMLGHYFLAQLLFVFFGQFLESEVRFGCICWAILLANFIQNEVPKYIFTLKLIMNFILFIGVEAIVVDYIRPSLFGGKTLIPNLCQGAVWLLSFLTLGGLYYFNYTDVGIVNAIKMLWSL